MGARREAPAQLTITSNRYRAIREVGRGTSGLVWLCVDAETKSQVALKIGRDAAERVRLADEAERLVLAQAACTARLLDAGVIDVRLADGAPTRLPYIALEWIDGASLASTRGGTPRERAARALTVARDVGRALSDLHLSGLSHGDLKPANVLLVDDAGAVLVDLGLADAADAPFPRGGTPRYLAPEVLAGQGGDGRTRDLWAFGLLLAEIASESVATDSAPARAAKEALSGEPQHVVRALLSASPWARPSAAWVHRTAARLLREPDDDIARRRGRIRRAYLAAHRPALARAARGGSWSVAVEGAPGDWLRAALEQLESVARLRGAMTEGPPQPIGPLDALGRAGWIQAVVEAPVAHWPLESFQTDDAVAEALIEAAEHQAPRLLTYAALVARRRPETRTDDPLCLALALGSAHVDGATLEAAEAWVRDGHAPPEMAAAVGRALRRRGDNGRAVALLEGLGTPGALVEAAEAARRSADRPLAASLVARARSASPSDTVAERLRALDGRLHLDGGDVTEAAAAVAGPIRSAAAAETRALVDLARAHRDTARDVAKRGLALAVDDEERARLEAVLGNVAHAAGDATEALEHFRRAVDHATRAGAVLEEATYLTGLAASSFDAARLAESLDAARRSALLFDYLGRTGDAGRALLARAVGYASVAATTLATEAAEEAIRRARGLGDDRCRAYAHVVMADIAANGPLDAREHAQRAMALVGEDTGDRLRCAARLHERGGEVDVDTFDAVARRDDVGVAARLDWWRARAVVVSPAASPEAAAIVAALASLAPIAAPLPTRGAAMAAGAALAARIGDGELARRLALPALEAARALVEGAPDELKAAAGAVPWATSLATPVGGSVSAAQLRDVETLVRALGTRHRLAPLLNQVLDALVLWSGVERGLLLLRAPGDRLVPRAARNLAREDLAGAQLELSHTLARRALATGEPVVAVDASGELSEVHESVHALRLRSVLAIPLIARGEALGVVYLDDRVRRGAFGPDERSWARLVAAIAAVAIADARDQLLLRRAARRARRAEAKLAAELATREAELSVAQTELARARDTRGTRFEYSAIIGQSEAVRKMLQMVDRVAASEVPVLVTGESGTGKELVARAIHEHGPRKDARFVTENCGAIPEGLLESTLFGHVRGAFTGASRPRIGLFQIADGGTLFLDEVGEMSLPMQAKLLRVLEDGEVKPVGSERATKVSVRVIAATHRDLSKMVDTGHFRRDLYYRLDVIAVPLPALRDRPGDVEILARHFIAKHATAPVNVSRAAMACLSRHAWPGNVRQLENEIRRALVLADGTIGAEHLSEEVRAPGPAGEGAAAALDLRRQVDVLEAGLVLEALTRTGGNQTRAAELLGLSRFGLQKMIKRLDVDVASTLDRSAP